MRDCAVVMGVGASRGLGGALARRFASEGMHVVVVGRTQEKLDLVVQQIAEAGGSAEARVADCTDEADVRTLFEGLPDDLALKAVLQNVGNNAIIPFAELSAERFEQFWRTCCLSGFLTAQAALPALEANGGSLLFTGASASLRGRPNFAHFAAAKSALRTLAQALAREYGPRGVHVGHVVVDGIIDGEIIRQHFGDLADKLGENGTMNVDDLAAVFWYLHTQAPSVWTFELDVRPYKEQW